MLNLDKFKVMDIEKVTVMLAMLWSKTLDKVDEDRNLWGYHEFRFKDFKTMQESGKHYKSCTRHDL